MAKKKIVRDNLSRKTIKDKLAAAFAKKPTASVAKANGVKTQSGLDQLKNEKFIQERIVKNAKNRKRFNNRPRQITDIVADGDFIIDAPLQKMNSYEFPSPAWFRKSQKALVSVIIPMYKSKEVILDLIKQWPIDDNLNVEVIFVDDACPQDCKEVVIKAWNARKTDLKRPLGRIICNKTNGGYGSACNSGANVATGEYLVFLNADTIVTKNWIQPMIDLFVDQKVGLVGNLHIKHGGGWNGTIDSAGSEWRWGDNSFVHIGRHSHHKKGISKPMLPNDAPKDIMEISEREMVTGCCFTIKRSLFQYIGGFNPNYRIGYWEDSELCMNVRELGYKVMFTPNSIIHHKLGHTTSGGHQFFRHNKNYFRNKWVASGRLHDLLIPQEPRPKINSILVKRTNATGDALVATGVCAALKKKHPGVKITFATLFPDVARNNPFIDLAIPITEIKKLEFDVIYNLDLSYEWRPNVNILDAYAEYCGVKKDDCEFYLKKEEYTKNDLPDDFIVIHPGKTNWVGRDWPHQNFEELAQKLKNRGEKIVCIGRHSEDTIPYDLDIRGDTNIYQLAWVLSKAKLFIGIDSFPMHVAQIANIPSIAFFGCIDPKLRIYNKKLIPITAKNLDCLGCHHRHPAPSTVTKTCETGTLDCIKQVSVTDMLELVKSMLRKPAANDLVSLMG